MSPPLRITHMPALILIVLVVSVRSLFAAPFITPNEAKTGALMIKSEQPGKYVEAPAVATDFEVTVAGPIIRTKLTQYFVNPANGWIEGLYVFPLPEDAAVDTLKMVIGDRVIIGDVKERVEAKKIYEKAKSNGQKAALIEQHRPNLFTNSIANIGPGETVLVQIEYQAKVRQTNGKFSFRLPTVVAPRFETPAKSPAVHTVSSEAGAPKPLKGDKPLPDAKPWLDPADNDPVNPINITVRLRPGFKVETLTSPHHKIITRLEEDMHHVMLADTSFADRDFELEWFAKTGAAPQAELFHEHVGGEDFVLIQVTPPTIAQTTPAPAREAIFVIDNSGSMAGPSIVQAKAGLIGALDRLQVGDTFNIVRFDDTLQVLFPHVVKADAGNISTAKRFVSSLDAEGGTNMIPALAAALKLDDHSNPAAIRQVIFLTDGAISGEQAMFNLIAQSRGNSRVFMVGIGSAPNSFLMTRAAEMGRGTFTHIGSAEQVAERMAELTTKLTAPAVTGVAANFSERGVKAAPDPAPDVYAGEPLYIYARMNDLKGSVTLSGLAGNDNWLQKIDFSTAKPGNGIAKLWARREISNTEVNRTLGTLNDKQADAMILRLALDHKIVSRLTSLVAVDATPSRPEGASLQVSDVPLNLPAGWKFEKVFGAKKPIKEAVAFKAMAVAATAREHQSQKLLALPQGSTPADLLLIFGLLLCLAGTFSITAGRRVAR